MLALFLSCSTESPAPLKRLNLERDREEMSSGVLFAVHQAAKEGNVSVLKKASKKDLNVPDEEGWTALHWASWNGSIAAIGTIVSKGYVS